MEAVNAIAGTPWDALTPNEWQDEGQKLLEVSQLFWFVDRVELREPLFFAIQPTRKCRKQHEQLGTTIL